MGLFDRVFRGSDEMYFKAEAELNAAIAELGEDAAMTMPTPLTSWPASTPIWAKRSPS